MLRPVGKFGISVRNKSAAYNQAQWNRREFFEFRECRVLQIIHHDSWFRQPEIPAPEEQPVSTDALEPIKSATFSD
jgi:hypothetical protein